MARTNIWRRDNRPDLWQPQAPWLDAPETNDVSGSPAVWSVLIQSRIERHDQRESRIRSTVSWSTEPEFAYCMTRKRACSSA
jgi:hypothetical protein